MDTPLSRGRTRKEARSPARPSSRARRSHFSPALCPALLGARKCARPHRPSLPFLVCDSGFGQVEGPLSAVLCPRHYSSVSFPIRDGPRPSPSVLALRNTRSQRERFHSRRTPSLRIRQETSEASSTGASRSEYERSPFRQGCGTCPLAPPSKAFPFWCHSRAALVFSKGLSARMLSKSRLA